MSTSSESRPSSALTEDQLQSLESLEGAIIEDPMSWREWFQFCIIRGLAATSIWIGPVLITIDRYGYEHLGLPLISFNWRPD